MTALLQQPSGWLATLALSLGIVVVAVMAAVMYHGRGTDEEDDG